MQETEYFGYYTAHFFTETLKLLTFNFLNVLMQFDFFLLPIQIVRVFPPTYIASKYIFVVIDRFSWPS